MDLIEDVFLKNKKDWFYTKTTWNFNDLRRFTKICTDSHKFSDLKMFIYQVNILNSPVILWFKAKVMATKLLSLPNDR